MSSVQKPQVNDARCWPPGSLMQFKSEDHFGIGLVVANRNNTVAVLWDRGCDRPFVVYKVETLNSLVISRCF